MFLLPHKDGSVCRVMANAACASHGEDCTRWQRAARDLARAGTKVDIVHGEDKWLVIATDLLNGAYVFLAKGTDRSRLFLTPDGVALTRWLVGCVRVGYVGTLPLEDQVHTGIALDLVSTSLVKLERGIERSLN